MSRYKRVRWVDVVLDPFDMMCSVSDVQRAAGWDRQHKKETFETKEMQN